MKLRWLILGLLGSLALAQGIGGRAGVGGKAGIGGVVSLGVSPSVLQSASNAGAGTVCNVSYTCITVTITSTTAHNALYVAVINEGNGTTEYITDSGAQTYQSLQGFGGNKYYVYYLCDIAAGVTTVTTGNSNGFASKMNVLELSGTATGSATICHDSDATVTTPGSTSFSVGPTGTLATAHDLAIGTLYSVTNAPLAPSSVSCTLTTQQDTAARGDGLATQTCPLSATTALTYSGTASFTVAGAALSTFK